MEYKTIESCKLNLHDVINTKQQTITGSIKDAFEGKNMQSE